MSHETARAWLILLLQLPPQPSSLRVRVWRRLQQIGAVAVKNAAYALPESATTLEDFQWLRQEIVDAGGGALLLRAAGFGEANDEILQLFRTERDQDYGKLAEEARALAGLFQHENDLPPEELLGGHKSLRQLRDRLERLREIDFFDASGASDAKNALHQAEQAVRTRTEPPTEPATVAAPGEMTGRLWVTRAGVYVDRLACAWIITRFIDPQARFAFVRPGEHPPADGVAFDMPGVQWGHHGTRCSAETLAAHFRPDDPTLRAVSELVHDLDLKDHGFGRPEAAGLKRLLDGICVGTQDDQERLRLAAPLFDALYSGFQQ